MTHYTCLVIGEDPEAMLAPFDENLEVPEYRDYEPDDPKDHWAYRLMTEEKQLCAPGAPWPVYAAAYNGAYGEDEGSPIQADLDTGRAYTLSTRNPRGRWDPNYDVVFNRVIEAAPDSALFSLYDLHV